MFEYRLQHPLRFWLLTAFGLAAMLVGAAIAFGWGFYYSYRWSWLDYSAFDVQQPVEIGFARTAIPVASFAAHLAGTAVVLISALCARLAWPLRIVLIGICTACMAVFLAWAIQMLVP